MKVHKITPVAIYFTALVAFVMHMVMYTAQDRANYLRHFSEPFNNRLEPLFQFYMWCLDLFFSPHTAIVITCSIIYYLFYKSWFYFKSNSFLLFFLFFNFVSFGVFNYYLGTSIRMGLAIAVGLYSAVKILDNVRMAWVSLVLSPFLHYGLVLFVIFFIWYVLTKRKSKRFHYVIAISVTFFCLFYFNVMLDIIGLNSYYIIYFTDGFGKTDRFIPFTIFYCILSFLFIILFLDKKLSKTTPEFYFLYLSSVYSLPLVLYQLVSGVAIFAKMLMPQFFFMSILVAWVFIERFYFHRLRYLYCFLFFVLNVTAIIYALRMYKFI